MLRVTHKKIKPKSRRVVFVGIVKDAQKLGVTREHLWQVLSGRRHSRRLIAAYRSLKRAA